MELTEPKPKKHCKLAPNLPFPVVFKKDGSVKKFTSYFNGFSVVISDPEAMKTVISMGYFGKATFSRCYPQFARGQVKILRQRQFENRKNCFDRQTKRPEKVILIPDSGDSENEEYFTNLKPKYELDYSGIKETVWLGLEEAFFLSSTVECLDITYNDQKMDNPQLWELFGTVDPNFIRNYIVYFYYRGKNWVVKPAIKFGGDFMLYKQGPPFYHATYIIIIEVVNQQGKRIESLTNHSLDTVSVLGLNRLCETAGKELLMCKVIWPEHDHGISYKDLTNIEIQETLLRRWMPSQEREDT